MKTISTLFTAILCLLGSTSFAQIDTTGTVSAGDSILLAGYVNGAPSGTNVVFTYQGGGMVNTFLVPCDASGSFYYAWVLPSDTGALTGSITTCTGTDSTITQAWGANTNELWYNFNYCNGGGGPVDECESYFYFANTDSLTEFTGDVYVYLPNVDPTLTYLWSFGTGDTLVTTFPVYEYPSFGTFTLCLTVVAPDGCLANFCDTFTVAEDGTVSGFGASSQGFTLKVVAEGTQLAVNEQHITTSIAQVFPNPVNETASLTVNSARANRGTMEIVNLQGQIMSRTNWSVGLGSTAIELPVETLRSGMYMVRLIDTNGMVSTTSFVK